MTRGIDEVRSVFEPWRQTRVGKARIPDELWSAAAEVARRVEMLNRERSSFPFEHSNLLSKSEDLHGQICTATEKDAEGGQERQEEIEHESTVVTLRYLGHA